MNELDVQVQLDYYMSAQFAGVACALEHGLYRKAGLDVTILPDCEPGKEPQHVLAAQSANPKSLCVGSIEQNVLVPYTAENGADKLVTVGAMFGRSPLSLAALPEAGLGGADKKATLTVGAHEDTVALLQRLMPDATVRNVPREAKLAMLKDGSLDAVQIYDCTESVTLRQEQRVGDGPLRVTSFEELGTGEATLGYAQVLFTTTEALAEAKPPTLSLTLSLTLAPTLARTLTGALHYDRGAG